MGGEFWDLKDTHHKVHKVEKPCFNRIVIQVCASTDEEADKFHIQIFSLETMQAGRAVVVGNWNAEVGRYGLSNRNEAT